MNNLKKLYTKEMGFAAGVIVYLLILVANSGSLTMGSKAMPMAVSIIIFLLIVLKVILALRSDKKASGVVDEDEQGINNDAPKAQPSIKEKLRNWKDDSSLRAAFFMIWIVIVGILINFIGYLPAMLVGLFILLITVSKISVIKSLAITVFTYAFMYAIFVMILNVRFPMGIFFE